MSGAGRGLPLDEALERILAGVAALGAMPVESVPLLDAAGRTLAEPAISPLDVPAWDNSAMDGFAARAADFLGAGRDSPVRLRVTGEVHAGAIEAARALRVEAGRAVRIMTGGPVPAGADSVIRIEDTSAWTGAGEPGSGGGAAGDDVARNVVLVFDDRDAKRNIRRAGEDVARGGEILPRGRVIRPSDVGLLASTGHARVAVRHRPHIALLATGDELADLDAFDEVLAGRRIVDSNSFVLAAAVRAAGGEPVLLGIAPDREAALRERIQAGLDCDALVTIAGASVGDHDLVKTALDGLGFRLDFWRVRMRPGSPFSFGWLGDRPVFGLPGNPVSALVTFEILVRPALRRMLGRDDVYPRTVPVVAAEPIPSVANLTHFLRARLDPADDGATHARLTGPQGSGILSSLSAADALLIVPEGRDRLEAGEPANAVPLAHADTGSARAPFPQAP